MTTGLPSAIASIAKSAVPAGVELVDDDVGSRVPRCAPRRGGGPRRSRGRPELARRPRSRARCPCGARLDGACDDERALAVGGGARLDRERSMPGGTTSASGHPADRVVGADDLRVGAPRRRRARRAACRGCPSRGNGRRDFLRAARRSGNWSGLRHEREPEVEVEDVGARQQPRERAPLRRAAGATSRAVPVERLVGLRVEPVALEDDEPRVDALCAAAPGRSSSGMPAMLTGQWDDVGQPRPTRPGRSSAAPCGSGGSRRGIGGELVVRRARRARA